MDQCTILARIPRRGYVKVCPTGCVHVTYLGVTLNFTAVGFQNFTLAIEKTRISPDVAEIEVDCQHVTMRYQPEEFGEFARLVGEGKRHLVLWQNQQRHEWKSESRHLPHTFDAREDLLSLN